jgi:hypothetical protein
MALPRRITLRRFHGRDGGSVASLGAVHEAARRRLPAWSHCVLERGYLRTGVYGMTADDHATMAHLAATTHTRMLQVAEDVSASAQLQRAFGLSPQQMVWIHSRFPPAAAGHRRSHAERDTAMDVHAPCIGRMDWGIAAGEGGDGSLTGVPVLLEYNAGGLGGAGGGQGGWVVRTRGGVRWREHCVGAPSWAVRMCCCMIDGPAAWAGVLGGFAVGGAHAMRRVWMGVLRGCAAGGIVHALQYVLVWWDCCVGASWAVHMRYGVRWLAFRVGAPSALRMRCRVCWRACCVEASLAFRVRGGMRRHALLGELRWPAVVGRGHQLRRA